MLSLFSILLLLSLAYSAALLYLRQGLSNLKYEHNRNELSASVIIAARDEAANIKACLNCVLRQEEPPQNYEVIVIDDRSEDETASIVRRLTKQHNNLRLLKIEDETAGISPKKRALQMGIQNSRGEIIVTTDADCFPGPQWLNQLMQQFAPEVGLVAGYNPYIVKKGPAQTFRKILALDYFAMAAVAAAGAGLNFPLSCSGGNLAYRKKLYEALGGFANTASMISGDDDLFLERVRDETNWQIRYSVTPETFVPTLPPESLFEFFHQRFRYASKGRYYAPKVVAGLLAVYLLSAGLTVGMLLCLFLPEIRLGVFSVFLLKSAAEFYFLKKAGAIFRQKFALHIYLLTALLHPCYIVLAVLGGQFAGFTWKGKRHRR